MGLIKNNIKIDWLSKYGFEYTNYPSFFGNPGYQNCYTFRHKCERLWVNICLKEKVVYLCNEYLCGGVLWEREINIPDEISINDECEFINWLDDELDID